jgi:hypothetical protein
MANTNDVQGDLHYGLHERGNCYWEKSSTSNHQPRFDRSFLTAAGVDEAVLNLLGTVQYQLGFNRAIGFTLRCRPYRPIE